jgi:hypothetical protein
MRLLCGLRQIDVWAGTGIPVGELSAAEQGRAQLAESEFALLVSYLHEKWKAIQESEGCAGPTRDLVKPIESAENALRTLGGCHE